MFKFDNNLISIRIIKIILY